MASAAAAARYGDTNYWKASMPGHLERVSEW